MTATSPHAAAPADLDGTELLGDLLEHAAKNWAERIALIQDERRLTYAELMSDARKVARLLQHEHGVGAGDRVMLVSDNRIEFVVAYFGILFAGGVVVPVNPQLTARELKHVLENSGATVVMTVPDEGELRCATSARTAITDASSAVDLLILGGPQWIAAVAHGDAMAPVRVTREDLAVIIYTSGTTGQPRGAELRHRNMRDNAVTGGRVLECDASRPDVTLCALPLFHSFGQSGMQNSTLAFGGTLVLFSRFDASAALELMSRLKVTYFGGVPTMFWRLVNAVTPDAPKLRLRAAVSGGSALPVQLHRDFKRAFGVSIIEGYGLSETSPLVCTSRLGEPVREGSIGRPVPGVEMRLIDPEWNEVDDGVGEIVVRGHNVMRGYHQMPEATAEVLRDGWLRTGDLARRDGDGFYYIVDRVKDMIIRGGYNVYPREIEEVLITHPAVSLVAVVGVPNSEHGEEIKAVVVAKEGHSIDPDELRSWSRSQLAAYKYPRIIEVRDSLPLGPTGKILKRQL